MPKVFPEYKKEAKCRVVQAAGRVFSKKGYHDTSMDDIAGELGVSRGALYQYFKSKDDILQEIFLLNQQSLREKLEQFQDEHDVLRTAERLFDEIAEAKRANMPIHFEVISLASHDEAIKKILLEDNEKDVEVVQAYIQKCIDRGDIRKDVDPHILAHLVIATYLRSVEKLIIGMDMTEVRKTWMEALKVILGIEKGA